MHGHLPNQCTLLKGMYVILNSCCTYPLHLILRQQPEKLWGKKNMNYTYNVDAYSFSGVLDFVNKLSHSMQIMKVKFVLSGGSQSWPFFYEWCCNFGLKLPHKTVIARLNIIVVLLLYRNARFFLVLVQQLDSRNSSPALEHTRVECFRV